MAKVDFPSNNKLPETETERKALAPVTKARVNDNPVKKLMGVFLAEDLEDAGDYFIRKILGPSMKTFAANLSKDIIDLIFYGQALGSYSDGPRTTSNRTRYNDVSRRQQPSQPKTNRTTGSLYEDPVVSSRGAAEIVLDQLAGTADEYGFARVLDLYELCDLETSFTQVNYGWTPEQINQARIMPIHKFGSEDEFIIKLPKPIQID